MKISRQVLKKEAMERSQLIRNDYMLRISEYSANQLVFLDESAANEHTPYRKFGWSAYGISPKTIRPVKRSERWSILPAYSLNGVLATHIHQGGITAARFEWFLENEVLPRCGQYPAPNSVLIMDNASIHHSSVRISYTYSISILIFYRV